MAKAQVAQKTRTKYMKSTLVASTAKHLHLTLVLATIERVAELQRCLEALLQQTDRRFDVVIVDQNTDGRLDQLVQAYQAQGIIIEHRHSSARGLSLARNLGLQGARGDVIGFPDDDCWYEPDTVAQILGKFEKYTSLDGLVGHWAEQAAANAPGLRTTHLLRWENWCQFRGGDASSITLFFRRPVLEQVSGFDERLGVGRWYGAGEETDLVLRLLRQGATLRHEPSVVVHHLFQPTDSRPQTIQNASHRSRSRGTGALYMKHRLGLWVVIRGLTAPMVRAIFTPASARKKQWNLACSTVMGRLEGLCRWRVQENQERC